MSAAARPIGPTVAPLPDATPLLAAIEARLARSERAERMLSQVQALIRLHRTTGDRRALELALEVLAAPEAGEPARAADAEVQK